MKIKTKLKVGDFLWWTRLGTSKNQSIDCPGVVTQVTEEGFVVQTFDNFLESELIPFTSVTWLGEMKKIKPKKAKAFCESRSRDIKKQISRRKILLDTVTRIDKELTKNIASIDFGTI